MGFITDNARRLQNRPINPAAPAATNVLAWNGIAWAPAVAGGGGASKYTFQMSLPSNASATPGLLSKANSTNGNPGGLWPTTSSGNPGINNGSIDPFISPQGLTIKTARLKVAHAAVAQATTGGAMLAQFDVYRLDYSARVLLGTINIPLAVADIFNNLGSNQFQSASATGLAIALAPNDCFGVEFLNLSANNNQINALGGIFLVLEAE